MTGWIVRRALQAAVTWATALALLFVLMRLAPGDPLAQLHDEARLAPADVERLRARYGLDQPVATQFTRFVAGAVRGDLGTSIRFAVPVTHLLRERLPRTALLGATVLLLTFGLGTVAGVWQARHRGRRGDRALTVAVLAAGAMPGFWVGLMLSYLFAVRWHLLPAAGMSDPLLDRPDTSARLADVGRHLVLPAVTLALVSLAVVVRHQRSAMLEALAAPFVVTARAKGLPERAVTWGHAWRESLGPMVTLLGLWLPLLVGGSLFVEAVFTWPGIGALTAEAVEARDYPVLMGTSVVVTTAVVLGSFLAELAQGWLDPRTRPA